VGLKQIKGDGFDDHEETVQDIGRLSRGEDFGTIEWTAALRAELLDPAGWNKILELYAGAMKLAVALIDAEGQPVGICHNPQPIWSLARAARPHSNGSCLFCLETTPQCSAAADALRTGSLRLVHDQAGFAHVALPLTLSGHHVGTLLAGQILDRYPEPLPLQRFAREFGVSQQQIWHSARQQPPISRANLTIYGELLWGLGQTFLRDRYGAILERRLTETASALNQELAIVNFTLNQKIAELDRSYGDLQNLIDSTEIAALFLDRELRIKRFTPAGRSLIHLEPGDIGRHITDLEERFSEPGVIEHITEVVRTFAVTSCRSDLLVHEQELAGAHGEHYLMRILPYCTIDGVIDGVVITFINVTKLKQAERRADVAKVYAENIVATVREPLLVLDDKFRVSSANDAFYEKFQTRVDETEGQLLFELGDGQWDVPELRKLLSEVLPRNQGLQNFELEQELVDKGPRTMVLNARQIADTHLILLAIEDITERKLAEDLLHKLNLNLQTFSHAAAHDLQEPLRMVTSYTQLLAREYQGKLDSKADQFIAYTLQGANQLETLLRDLRHYWVASEHTEPCVPIDSGRVLRNTIEALTIAITESDATVTHGPLPTVLAEEVSLAMLFQNLVGNAIKYRKPEEQPRIHISAQKKATTWCFSVKDNGIGIKAEHLEEVFAPFKRLHGKEYPGSGIGLALCKKIVERYGGRLWVESTPGYGSTFHFTIPKQGKAVT
jgi:signal transduction histidine kinase/ligand-binding sensor protein